MNIDLWHGVLAVAVAGTVVGLGSRWWFRRQLAALQRERAKLDASHQSTLRTVSQARKQIEDLQRLVAEHRRKITTIELERRRVKAKLNLVEALDDGTPASAVRAASWADTQPL